MVSKPSPTAPAAPDAAKTAAIQQATNNETAQFNAALNNVDQITPYGTLTYSNAPGVGMSMSQFQQQPGYNNMQTTASANAAYQNYLSSNGLTAPGNSAADYQSTITLSPQQQQILDNQQNLQIQAQGLGGTALSQFGNNLATPYSLGGAGITPIAGQGDISGYQNQVAGDIMSRIQPQLDKNTELLNSQLANQGITQGSAAYNNAINLDNQAKNDAYTQSQLSAVQAGQTYQNESLAAHDQNVSDYNQQYYAPLNTYTSLANGVQVQNPTFAGSGQAGGASGASSQPANYSQDAMNSYNAALNSYNQQVAGNNSTMGGLFGLGGSFLGAAMPGGTSVGGSLLSAGLSFL
jgi:hypothetical protein